MQRSTLRFENAIKSEHTRKMYRYYLENFKKFVKIREDDGLLQLKESFLQEAVEDFLFDLKKKISPNSIPQRFSALQLFFSMNDKVLNWEKIKKMFPATVKRTGGEAWSTQDIKKMLESTKSKREKALIHFLASTGCRIGAIPDIKLKHVSDIENCKTVKIYEGTTEEYTVFLTPEASIVLDEYLNKRKSDGEILSSDSPLFRQRYRLGGAKVKPVNTVLLKAKMTDVIHAANIERLKQGRRYSIQLDHGFRKRFNTLLKNNSIGNIALKEKLMGHKGVFDLDGRYHKPDVKTLFEEFKLHITNLVISDSERDKITIAKLSAEKSESDKKAMRIAELEEQVAAVIHKLDLISGTKSEERKPPFTNESQLD
ncbi:MAG: site-specific integrase [Thaumarchaeota archaeon]|nr:site-specific integrase [Nitrososphaerota archaeon]